MELTAGYADGRHRQPALTPLDGGPVPSSAQWEAIAAVWLLAAWTRDATPGWRGECVTGTAPERDAQPWPSAIGDFPGGPGQASSLICMLRPGPGQPHEPTRPPAEVTAELISLLSDRIPATEPRAASLLAHLAELLTGQHMDLLRLTTGGDDLHLLQRDTYGRTLRLTVTPSATTEPPPSNAADGDDAALRTRLACLVTLLSAQLWVNNNNPVTFRVWIGPRGDADPLTAATEWWTRTREDEPDDPPQLRPVTVEDLDRGLYTIVRSSLLDLFDGSWSGVEEWPHVPPGHLTRHLYRDLLDLLLTRTGGPAGPPDILCTGYLPVTGVDEDLDDEGDYFGTVMFVGGTDVAVLDLDLTC